MDTVMKSLRPSNSQTGSLEIPLKFFTRGWEEFVALG